MAFAAIPTFLDAPCRSDVQDLPDFGGIDIALLGVPMDLGVTNRDGSPFGPRAVRTIERRPPIRQVPTRAQGWRFSTVFWIRSVPSRSASGEGPSIAGNSHMPAE